MRPVLKLEYFPAKCAVDTIVVRTDQNKVYYNTGPDVDHPRFELISGHDLPIGTIISTAVIGDDPPAGYLECDGSMYKVDEYRALYDVIRGIYGGEFYTRIEAGIKRWYLTKFAVPNFCTPARTTKTPLNLGGPNDGHFFGEQRMPLGGFYNIGKRASAHRIQGEGELRFYYGSQIGGSSAFRLNDINMPRHSHTIKAIRGPKIFNMGHEHKEWIPCGDNMPGAKYRELLGDSTPNSVINNEREVLELEFYIKYA